METVGEPAVEPHLADGRSTSSVGPRGPVSRPRTRKSPIASECSQRAGFPSTPTKGYAEGHRTVTTVGPRSAYRSGGLRIGAEVVYRDGREARRGVIKSKRLPSSALARLQALPARAAALPGLDALWLFGSHARGDATPLSDVDLAYLEDLEAPLRDRTPAFDARIYDALSGFLGTDEISLVDLETAPPALALRVFREGRLLFCRNPRHVADVLERVLIRYPEVRRLIVQGLEGEERGAMEIDRDKVLAQLRLLDGDLRRLREKASLAAENYLADLDAQDAVLRRFQTAVEACSNIGNHLIARLRLRVAEDYAGVFTVLGEEGIVGRELAARMAELARFRNLVVHMYWRVDHARVFSEMAERIRALEEFQDSVRRFLAPPGPQESKA